MTGTNTPTWEVAYCSPDLNKDPDGDGYPSRIDPCPDDKDNVCKPSYKYIADRCPFEVKNYEELLLRSVIYYFSDRFLSNAFTDEQSFKSINDSANGFDGKYLDEYNVGIKPGVKLLILDGLDEISQYLLSEHVYHTTSKSVLDEKDYGFYMNDNQINFLAHKIYYEHQDGSAQQFVLWKLKEDAEEMSIWELLTWSGHFGNAYLAWDKELIKTMNKTLQKYIYKPYIDYLKAEQYKLIESLLLFCKSDTSWKYQSNTMCVTTKEGSRWWWGAETNEANEFNGIANKLIVAAARIYLLENALDAHKWTWEYVIDFRKKLFGPIRVDIDKILKPETDLVGLNKISSHAKRLCKSDPDCLEIFIEEVFIGHYLETVAKDLQLPWFNSDLVIELADTSWIIDKMQERYENFVRLDVFYKKFWEAAEYNLDNKEPGDIGNSGSWELPTWFLGELAHWFECNKPLASKRDIVDMLSSMKSSAENWINSIDPVDYFGWKVGENIVNNWVINDDVINKIFQWNNKAVFTVSASPVEIKVETGGDEGGCPLVYVKWEDSSLKFNWFISIYKMFKFLKWDSFIKLMPEVHNWKIEVSIAEILPETFYLDNVSLIHIKHWNWADINIDNKWNIYSLTNTQKISFKTDQDSSFVNIDLWTFDKEKVIKMDWGIYKGNYINATYVVNIWLNYVKKYFSWNPALIGIVHYVLNDSFIWEALAKNVLLPFYSVEFQYFTWDDWEMFDYIGSYWERRIVKIDSELLNKKIRIRYNKNINKINWLWESDTTDNFSSEEVASKSSFFSKKINKQDNNYQLINSWEKIDLSFDVENFDKDKSTLLLKVNWYYNIPSFED